MELAAAAAGTLPDQADEIVTIADRYRRLRYAAAAPDARSFLSAVRKFKAKTGHLDRT
jgi:hypothetical protein